MNNLLHRDAIPEMNAAAGAGAALTHLLVGAVSLAWLAAGFLVWWVLMVLALLAASLTLPYVLARRLFGRRP